MAIGITGIIVTTAVAGVTGDRGRVVEAAAVEIAEAAVVAGRIAGLVVEMEARFPRDGGLPRLPRDPPGHGVLHGFAREMNMMVMGHEERRVVGGRRRDWDHRGGRPGARRGQPGVRKCAPASSTGCFRRWSTRPAGPAARARSIPATPSRRSRRTSASTATPRPRTTADQGGDETYERLRQVDFADYRLEVAGLVEPARAVAGRTARCPGRSRHATPLHPGLDSIGHGGACGSPRSSTAAAAAGGAATWSSTHSPGTRRRQAVLRMRDPRPRPAPPDDPGLRDQRRAAAGPARAPLRLRLETKLGFKMVKFLRAIELVEDYRNVGDGRAESARTTSNSTWGPRSDLDQRRFYPGRVRSPTVPAVVGNTYPPLPRWPI